MARRWRWLLAGALSVSLAGGSAATAGPPAQRARASARTAPPVAAPVAYRAPIVPALMLTPFHPPPDKYGAGHLGVDLAAAQGAAVAAAADGVVVFSGQVAGRGVVVVLHADGIRTEYEPVRPALGVHAAVRRGQVLGVVDGVHAYCRGRSCLHWGARRGQTYIDPMSLLEELGPVRLLPW